MKTAMKSAQSSLMFLLALLFQRPHAWRKADWRKSALCFALVLGLLHCALPLAAQKLWIGGATGAWNTGTNWMPAGAPVPGDIIRFTSDATVTMIPPPPFNVAGIDVQGGSTVVLSDGGLNSTAALSINGTLRVAGLLSMSAATTIALGNTLDVQSGGRVVVNGVTITNNGSIQVQNGGTLSIVGAAAGGIVTNEVNYAAGGWLEYLGSRPARQEFRVQMNGNVLLAGAASVGLTAPRALNGQVLAPMSGSINVNNQVLTLNCASITHGASPVFNAVALNSAIHYKQPPTLNPAWFSAGNIANYINDGAIQITDGASMTLNNFRFQSGTLNPPDAALLNIAGTSLVDLSGGTFLGPSTGTLNITAPASVGTGTLRFTGAAPHTNVFRYAPGAVVHPLNLGSALTCGNLFIQNAGTINTGANAVTAPVVDLSGGGAKVLEIPSGGSVSYSTAMSVGGVSSLGHLRIIDNGAVIGTPPVVYNNVDSFLEYAGTVGRTTTNTEFPDPCPAQVIINNAGHVTLNAPKQLTRAAAPVLVLTNGKLITAPANTIGINLSSSPALSGGSATSFVEGPFRRNIPFGAVSRFAVGKGMTYLPLSLNPAVADVDVTIEAFATNPMGTASGLLVSPNEYWSVFVNSGPINAGSSFSAQPTNPPPTGSVLGRSPVPDGSYAIIGGTVSGAVITGAATGTGLGTGMSMAIAALLTPPAYTWNAPPTGDWQVAANWTPPRTTPSVNDVLWFTNGMTNTVTNVPSQTIFGLRLTNVNTQVNLQGQFAGSTLTITDAASLNLGGVSNALRLNTAANHVNLSMSAGSFLRSMAGTVDFGTAATVSGAGSMHLAGTVVTSNPNGLLTGSLNTSGPTTLNPSPIVFDLSAGNIQANLPATVGQVNTLGANILTLNTPVRMFNPLNVGGGEVRVAQPTTIGGGSIVASGARLSVVAGQPLSLSGSMTIQSGGTLNIEGDGTVAGTPLTYAVGSALMYSGAPDKTIGAEFTAATLNGNLVIAKPPANRVNVGAVAKTVTGLALQSGVLDLTGASTLTINSGLTVGTGQFASQANTQLALNAPATGTLTWEAGNRELGRLGFGTLATGTVNIGSPLTVNTLLEVLGGIVALGSNLLTVTNTAVGAVTWGMLSSTRYIDGALARAFNGAGPYAFPLGRAGQPLEIRLIGSSSAGMLRAEAFAANPSGTPGAGIGGISTTEYWRTDLLSGTLTGQIGLFRPAPAPAMPADTKVGRLDNVGPAGTYNSAGPATFPGGTAITSSPLTSPTSTMFFAIGLPPTVYVWNGAVNNDWQEPNNWTPPRTTIFQSDRLHFTAAGTHNIVNVPNQTIGQLYVSSGDVRLEGASAGNTLTVDPGTANQVFGSGVLRLNNTANHVRLNMNAGGGLVVLTPGHLDAGHLGQITGAGSINLNGGQFSTANANGVAGSITTTGPNSFNPTFRYNFDASAGNILTNVPTTQCGVVFVTGAAGNTVTLNSSLRFVSPSTIAGATFVVPNSVMFSSGSNLLVQNNANLRVAGALSLGVSNFQAQNTSTVTFDGPAWSYTGGLPVYSATSTLEYAGGGSVSTGAESNTTPLLARLLLNKTSAADVVALNNHKTINNLVQINSGTLRLANGAPADFWNGTGGNALVMGANARIDLASAQGLVIDGASTLSAGHQFLAGAGTTDLAFEGAVTGVWNPPAQLRNLEVNVGAGALTMGGALALNATGSLTLTTGRVVSSDANFITLANPAATAIAGAPFDATKHIDGPLAWSMNQPVAYTLPLGKGGQYLPLVVQSPGTMILQAEAFNTGSGGTGGAGIGSISTQEYWRTQVLNGSWSLTRTVGLTPTTPPVVGTTRVGWSNVLNGSYTGVGGNVVGTDVFSTAPMPVWNAPATTFLVVGEPATANIVVTPPLMWLGTRTIRDNRDTTFSTAVGRSVDTVYTVSATNVAGTLVASVPATSMMRFISVGGVALMSPQTSISIPIVGTTLPATQIGIRFAPTQANIIATEAIAHTNVNAVSPIFSTIATRTVNAAAVSMAFDQSSSTGTQDVSRVIAVGVPFPARLGAFASDGARSATTSTTTVRLRVTPLAPKASAQMTLLASTASFSAPDTSRLSFPPTLALMWSNANPQGDTAQAVLTAEVVGGGVLQSTSVTVTVFSGNLIPKVTDVAPKYAAAGQNITITGANFVGITSVRLGGVPVQSYTVSSTTSIIAVVGSTGATGHVLVIAQGGRDSVGTFEFAAPPQITSFTPTVQSAAQTVTIRGRNFKPRINVSAQNDAVDVEVQFGNTRAASWTVNNDSTITAIVSSAGATGLVRVTTIAGTTTSTAQFTFLAPPAIGGFSPTVGTRGSVVTVTGANFSLIDSAAGVTIGGVPVRFTRVSDTRLDIIIEDEVSGKIRVVNPVGFAESPQSFTYTFAPLIFGVSPTVVPAGTPITITGANFQDVRVVSIGGQPARFTVLSTSAIQVVVPVFDSSSTIRVITPLGVASTTTTLTLVRPPTITSFAPTTATVRAVVTISGTNFITNGTVVLFGGVPADTVFVDSQGQLRAVVPRNAASGIITVSNAAGVGVSAGMFTFIPQPQIISFNPAAGGVRSQITISGSFLNDVREVRFGGVLVDSIVSVSASQVVVRLSSGATGRIEITTAWGIATSATMFNFLVEPNAPPFITNFMPREGDAFTRVTINGSNFLNTTSVTIGGVAAASFRVTSAFSIVALVSERGSTGTLEVRTPNGIAVSRDVFRFIPPPPDTTLTPLQRDSLVLAQFYRATQGESWTEQRNWLSSLPINQWSGVRVDSTGGGERRVTHLELPYNNLTGTIPASLARLGALTVLNLTGNRIAGGVPPELLQMPNLEVLALDSNQLSAVPQVWNAPRLVAVRLNDNLLVGDFPTGLCASRSLRVLALHNNRLGGLLPACLGDLSALQILSVSNNMLEGSIPVELGRLARLEFLMLANNRLSGSIPATFAATTTATTATMVAANMVAAKVPGANDARVAESLGALGALKALDVSRNALSGEIPAGLWTLRSLQDLYLSGNRLSGELPNAVGNLTNLRALLAESCGLRGTLPQALGTLPQLQVLALDSNAFTGAVPESFRGLLRLRRLGVSANRLTSVPNLSNIASLRVLRLQRNRLSFGSLEGYEIFRRLPGAELTYIPQDSLGEAQTVNLVVGERLTLSAETSGAANQYQWYQVLPPSDGTAHGRVEALHGETAAQLRRTSVAAADSGVYVCRVTNRQIRDLELWTRPITVRTRLPERPTVAVQLNSPANAAVNIPTSVLLTWQDAGTAVRYELQISRTPDFSTPVLATTVQNASQFRISGLQHLTTYVWRVRAVNDAGAGPWSPAWSFTTLPFGVALTVSPVDFGRVPLGDSVVSTMEITNETANRLTITNLDIVQGSAAAFSFLETPANLVLDSGKTAQVRVRFAPSQLASLSAGLRVGFSAQGGAPQTLTQEAVLRGRAAALKLLAVNFDTVLVGQPALRTLFIINRSDRSVRLNPPTIVERPGGVVQNPFSIERLFGERVLAPRDTASFTVQCLALDTGRYSGTARIVADIDSATVSLFTAAVRRRLPNDISVVLEVVPDRDSAAPGDLVLLKIRIKQLLGLPNAAVNLDSTRTLNDFFRALLTPTMKAVVTFQRSVLVLDGLERSALETGSATDPITSLRLTNVRWNGTDSTITSIRCRAVSGNLDTTLLIIKDIEWAGGMQNVQSNIFSVANTVPRTFRTALCRADGLRLTNVTRQTRIANAAPNPAMSEIAITYSAREQGVITLSLVNAQGQSIKRLVNAVHQPGIYSLRVDVSDVPSGVYTLLLQTPSEQQSERIVVVR